jgi:two-component system, LytTR family, response regulator
VAEGRFRAVVVDDEPVARDAVVTLLRDERAVEVVAEAGSGDEAVRLVRELRPDLLFLDVQMPGKDGFQVLEALGSDVPRAVVFVTAFDTHALRAFEVHALDYVVKPFGRPRFQAAVTQAVTRLAGEDALSLQRTLESMSRGRTPTEPGSLGMEPSAPAAGLAERLAVRIGSRVLLVNLTDVDWLEADADYVRIHAGNRIHLVSMRLQALEERLDPERFFRIHRSILVNLARVEQLHRSDDGGGVAVLSDGVRLRVARGRWEDLERALRTA